MWLGENLHSFGRLCVVVTVGGALIVLAQTAQVRQWLVLVLCLLSCLTCWRSHIEWQSVQDARLGNYSGLAILKSDPQPIGRGVRVVLEIEGQRFESWLYGSPARRMALHVSGESVEVVGQRRPNGEEGRRLQVRHIVGQFEAISIRTFASGAHISESRFELAANRVRSALGEGSRVLSGDLSALFAGLVYGDDSQQPPEMVDRFRESGLAHLTAVSGQNVAFVMAILAPLISRLRRWNRLALTILVLGWFAIMTRLEPSVIRAVTMAGITATVFAIGGRLKAWQVLCVTCISLLILDPFLLWSVGWWLSIGGSSGLIVLSPRIRTSLQYWGLKNHPWVVDWVAPSLAAQLGVLPILVLVFGWPSAMSIPCNLLAVPIAGLVMLAGIPTALIAGFAPHAISEALMWPLGFGVKWVDTVAALGQHLNPPPVIDIATAIVPLFLLLSHRCENLET